MNYLAYLHRKQMEALDGRVYDPPDPNIYGDPPRSWHYPKKEEAMTPTPDPPPAAPLTAEEIAAIRAHYNKMTSGLASWELYDIPALLDSHAALRDRLARAEEALSAVVAHAEAGAEIGAYEQALFDCRFDAANALGLLAAPTDGAARAGDAG